MFTTIVLALAVLIIVWIDHRTCTQAKITPDVRAIINLRRKKLSLIFRVLVALGFIGFWLFQVNSGAKPEPWYNYTLIIIFIGYLIKIELVSPKRLVVTDKEVRLPMVSIPKEAVAGWTITDNGELVIMVNGLNKPLPAFVPRDVVDYDAVVYAAEHLGMGQSQEIIKQHRLAQIASQARGIFPMQGVVKDYDWGGHEYIANQLGLKPQLAAEYWLGTHQSGMATIQIEGKELKDLTAKFYSEHPEQTRIEVNPKEDYNILLNYNLAYGQPLVAGSDTRVEELPFLFKILDVARPLSIQLHPDKETAERGYKNDDLLGIPLTDGKRNFKDRNHKPELMVALSDFYLLHGFKTKEAILELLNSKPALAKLAELFATHEVKDAYAKVMQMSKAEIKEYLNDHLQTIVELYEPLITKQLTLTDINQKVEVAGLDSDVAALDPDYWVAFTYQAMKMDVDNLDVGLVSFYIYNLLKVHKYQGIFQAANVPHAYLRGQNLEAMAQSDNVIRGGLTTKYINIKLLLQLINTNPVEPKILELGGYDVPVDDFVFSIKQFNGSEDYQVENASIAYVLSGNGEFSFTNQSGVNKTLKAKTGSAFFISAGQRFNFDGRADVAITSCKESMLAAYAMQK